MTRFWRRLSQLRERLLRSFVTQSDRSFAVSSASALALRLLGTAALLLLQIALARVLAPGGYGTYIYVYSWLTVLTLFATFGLDTASLRFVSQYVGSHDRGLLRGYLRHTRRWVLGASLLLSAGLVISVLALRARIPDDLFATFLIGALALPLLAFVQVLASILRGLKQVVWALAPQALFRPLLLGAAIAGLAASRGLDLLPAWVMALEAMVAAVLVFGMSGLVSRRLPEGIGETEPSTDTGHWVRTSVPLLVMTASKVLMNRTDIIMLGLLLSTTSAGLFAAAVQISAFLGFGLVAVNSIAAPMFADLHARRQGAELQRIARWSALAGFGFSTVTGVALVLLGPAVLRLYGPDFAVGYLPLLILVAAQILSALCGSVGFILSMTGNERVAAKVTALTGIMNVVLNGLLIPRFGLVGAAVATAVSSTTWNLILLTLVVRRLGINPTILGSVAHES